MPAPNNSIKLLMWFTGILVTVLIVVVTAVANQSRSADAAIVTQSGTADTAIITQSTAADLKLDTDKVDKAVFKAYKESEEKENDRMYDQMTNGFKDMKDGFKQINQRLNDQAEDK